MPVDGIAAANTMIAFGTWRAGYCLEAVWQAFKRNGARTDRGAPTAYAGWLNSDDKHPGDRNPPAGVPVWWGPKASSAAGDVVISLGGGRVVATDWPYNGVIGITTIDARERQIGRPYLGWTGDILGAPISYPTTAGGGTAPAPNPSGEDDMTAEQYNAMMWELACNRPIKMYHLVEADGSGGWVWVGPTGKAWIVPNPQYAVLADAQKISQVRPVRSMDRNEFHFLTSQLLPNTNPIAIAAEAELDRIVALDADTVAKIVEGIGENTLPVALNDAQLAAVTAAALNGAKAGGEDGAKAAIAGLSFVVSTGA